MFVRLDIYPNQASPLSPVTVSASVCANASIMNGHKTESPLFEGTPLNWVTKQLLSGGYRCSYFIYASETFSSVYALAFGLEM